ncbi:MAG: GNAT family N-acetyltransferase [Acidobacteria bacterium]|nr:GNAT family N-acetyltransferase [Acidobacteriota bacterium]
MVEIRRATEEDLGEVVELHRRSVRGIRGAHYAPEVIEAWAVPRGPEHYVRAVREKEFFVAEDEGGHMVGFGVLNVESREVEAVYVSPEATRGGTGLKILRTLEGRARERGLDALHLNASLNGIPFYERAGFERREAGTHRLQSGVEMACVLMTKRLGAPDEGAEGDRCREIF